MSLRPNNTNGYVYYLRLKTHKGIFYKIGYTSKDSINERFSYGNSENHKLVDKVLMFKYCVHAYDIEQRLHLLFRKYRAFDKNAFMSAFKDFSQYPFYKDGQSELYKRDILNLDFKPPFKFFGTYRCYAIEKRKLYKTRWHESVEADFIKKDEQKGYDMISTLLEKPLFETKSEFIERHGAWVHSLVLWGIKNSACAFWEDSTIHGAKPMPETKEGLLQLKKLSPVWGYVDCIPKEIAYLKNLEVVEFGNKGLTEIPEELFTLPNLKKLVLWGNDFTSISNKIENLTELEELNISFNSKLKSLPTGIATLKKLRHLNVDKEHWKFLIDIGVKSHVFLKMPTFPEEMIEQEIIKKYGYLGSCDINHVFSNGHNYQSVIRQFLSHKSIQLDFPPNIPDGLLAMIQQHIEYCSEHTWEKYLKRFDMVSY